MTRDRIIELEDLCSLLCMLLFFHSRIRILFKCSVHLLCTRQCVPGSVAGS